MQEWCWRWKGWMTTSHFVTTYRHQYHPYAFNSCPKQPAIHPGCSRWSSASWQRSPLQNLPVGRYTTYLLIDSNKKMTGTNRSKSKLLKEDTVNLPTSYFQIYFLGPQKVHLMKVNQKIIWNYDNIHPPGLGSNICSGPLTLIFPISFPYWQFWIFDPAYQILHP